MSAVAHDNARSRSILFVIGTLDVGGAETHLTDIARALVKRGWDVSVYCIARGGPLQAKLEAGGVEVYLPPAARYAHWAPLMLLSRMWRESAAVDLWQRMIRLRPSIVHFFLPGAYILGAPVALAALRPIRVMSRRSLNHYQAKSPRLRRFELRLHPWMTAILGNSVRILDDLAAEGASRERSGVIYNGIDVTRFDMPADHAATRAALGLGPDTLVLTIVANLIPYKGHADLIEALGLAAPDMPADWRLLVIGRDDGIGTVLKEQAAARGLAASIRFLGPRTDVVDILSVSDIGILSSHEEGFSNALLEGMAAGLPMIATDVGGNPEAISDGQSGLIVPPRDPRRMAEAIVRLANDAGLRRRLGVAARARVAERFTLDRCVQAYDLFYRELLAGRRPAEIAHIQPR